MYQFYWIGKGFLVIGLVCLILTIPQFLALIGTAVLGLLHWLIVTRKCVCKDKDRCACPKFENPFY